MVPYFQYELLHGRKSARKMQFNGTVNSHEVDQNPINYLRLMTIKLHDYKMPLGGGYC